MWSRDCMCVTCPPFDTLWSSMLNWVYDNRTWWCHGYLLKWIVLLARPHAYMHGWIVALLGMWWFVVILIGSCICVNELLLVGLCICFDELLLVQLCMCLNKLLMVGSSVYSIESLFTRSYICSILMIWLLECGRWQYMTSSLLDHLD